MSRIYEALKKAEQEAHSGERDEHRAPSAQALFEPASMTAVPVPPLEESTRVDTLESAAEGIDLPAEDWTAINDVQHAAPEALNLSPLDACPRKDWTPGPKLIAFSDRHRGSSVGAEQFRRLRSRLYELRGKQSLKRVLVSSAIPGEGKTFVCANLAQALTRHGRTRVLLIDADLRKPSLHSEFGTAATPGLSDYLQGSADEFAAIQRGPVENLFFMAAGSSVANPADMISGGRFQALMQRANELFDWVIVDSSPVVPISDATVLAQHCDGVLLVVKAQSTPFDLAQRARDEFRNSVLLGVVLNQVSDVSAYTPYYYNAYKGAARSSEAAQSTT